jgi:tRNA-specific 2-thiouridylase
MKFGRMLDRMLSDGCDAVATGHYARTADDGTGRIQLLKGRDLTKDQSYFLAGLSQDQLRRILFPLGEWVKEDVKAEARRRALIAADKGESQDLCFLPDGEYARLVADMRPELTREGPIVDTEGHVLGTHYGMFHYTIGQRRGIGLSGGPWYVVAIDPDANTVTVAPRRRLGGKRVHVRSVNWICRPPRPETTLTGMAKLRYNMKARPATAFVGKDPAEMILAFDEPVFAITPGQFAVIYDGDNVLGGGWIQGAETEAGTKDGHADR